MGRDFHQEEEDLDNWFDEEKERLSRVYFQGLENSRRKFKTDEEGAEHKKRQKAFSHHELKSTFALEMLALREEYHKRYMKIVRAQARASRIKGSISRLREPASWLYWLIANNLVLFYLDLRMLYASRVVPWMNGRQSECQDMSHSIREFFIFTVRPKFGFLSVPYRRLYNAVTRPVNRCIGKVIDTKKKYTDAFMKALHKYLDIISKFIKKYSDLFKKHYKVYEAIYNKHYRVIRNKYREIKEKIEARFKKESD